MLISINHSVQWIRVEHLHFLRGSLSYREEANLEYIAAHEGRGGEAQKKMDSSKSVLKISEVANSN